MQEQDLEYAGFWIRTGAAIIDSILIMLITFPLLISIYGTNYFDPEITGFIAGPAHFLISWVLPAIAVIVFWIYKAATPENWLTILLGVLFLLEGTKQLVRRNKRTSSQ